MGEPAPGFKGVGEGKGAAGEDDDDDVDEHEEMLKRLHPELRKLVRRYGLLFLPYSQRTWFWELFSMSNKHPSSLLEVEQ